MIEILGVNEGKEFEAAAHLRKQMLAVWPDIAQSKGKLCQCSERYQGVAA
jgi:hypothetical protein